MNLLAPVSAPASQVSTLVESAGDRAQTRFFEFFAAEIRNGHTRGAYAQATREFLAWCESAGVASIADVKPLHVAAYIEHLGRERSQPAELRAALPRTSVGKLSKKDLIDEEARKRVQTS
jgi:integrase/recombinase XerC